MNGGGKFTPKHAFIGYQEDTPAAVVFQASRQLKRLKKDPYLQLSYQNESLIFGDIQLEELLAEDKGSNMWKVAVSFMFKCVCRVCMT